MNKKNLQSPFFTITDQNELKYLNKKTICTLSNEKSSNEYILKNEGVLIPNYKKNNYKNKALIIEPHSDDFALSALAYTLDNVNVKVLNIFSKTSLDYFTWNNYITITEEEYENLRLQESTFAVEKVLKESFVSLKEKSTRLTNKSKQEIEDVIINSILKILKEDKTIDRILIPMGIGNHPDHLIVYNSIINNIEKLNNYKIIMYPEYPYTRSKISYSERINKIKKDFNLKPIIIDISKKIDIIADIISIYKSQFDDINRNQMLAIIREDGRALATDYNTDDIISIYFEVGDKNEN